MDKDIIYQRSTSNHLLSPSEAAWLREYGTGMQLFVNEQATSAYRNLKHHKPTLAVIACRKALEIPVNRYPFIKILGETVASAAMRRQPNSEATYLYNGVIVQQSEELAAIEQSAREQLQGKEFSQWVEALTSLTNDTTATSGIAHSAGIAALELAKIHTEAGYENGALSSYQRNCYRIAATAFRRRRTELPDSWEQPLTGAESDEVHAQLMTALTLLVTHYTTQNIAVKGQARDELMKLTYEIDDIHSKPELLQQEVHRGRILSSHELYNHDDTLILLKQAYELLVRSSSFRESRYFKKEAAAIHIVDDETLRTEGERPAKDKRPKPTS